MSVNDQSQQAAAGLPPGWFFGAGDRAVPGRPDMHASPLSQERRDVAAHRHHLANQLQNAAFNLMHAAKDLVADDRVGALLASLERVDRHRAALLEHELALRAEVTVAVLAHDRAVDRLARTGAEQGQGVDGGAVSQAS